MAHGEHVPVLVSEVVAALAVRPGGRYIDATLGGGGHATAILERSAPDGRILALDRDPQALAIARARLEPFGDRAVLRQRSFAELGRAARECGFEPPDGILFDLGFSSLQLADPARGFSFQNDGPLDMRFDPAQDLTAAEIVNEWPEQEIADLIFRFAEEPRARRIARAIIRSRPLHTTTELADAVARAIRRQGRIHPATRTFQALRIAVNDELGAIAAALPQALELLRGGGRLAIISFHSLEDRLVKNTLREQQALGRVSLPVRKPVTASAEELKTNARSRSAKLRIAEKVAHDSTAQTAN